MRISSLYYPQLMSVQMSSDSDQTTKLMKQIVTQSRVNLPSDDPVAAARLMQLNQQQSSIDQYHKNIQTVSSSLSMQEGYIDGLSHTLLSIQTELQSANNSTNGDQDMASYGQALSSMLDTLVGDINAQDANGNYLFSGTQSDTPPVVLDPKTGHYVYQGNDNTRQATVGDGQTIQQNTTVASAFSGSGDDLSMLNDLKDLSDKMLDPKARLSDYQSQFAQVIQDTQDSESKVAALFTSIGDRQNQMQQLDSVYTNVSMVNQQVVQQISGVDMPTNITELQMYLTSAQMTNKVYSMVNSLSLFNSM
ncbi:flagellar hook-associated protein FlgL [Enterobacter ludwigii]|uniref:flagellar hook-associated protein FlgL n=1 Tax=Enterobacter ludwigii TaxID=299767 RepID=UPI003F71D185